MTVRPGEYSETVQVGLCRDSKPLNNFDLESWWDHFRGPENFCPRPKNNAELMDCFPIVN